MADAELEQAFVDGKWVFVPLTDEMRAKRAAMLTFSDIQWWYANVIDYFRVVLVLLSGVTIALDWPVTTALLLYVATLLDWIDGPVARRYNQCSVFGSGIDWVADILGQVAMTIWWARLNVTSVPFLLTVSTIEIVCGVFDFAVTATLTYPKLQPNQKGFFIILEWSMPENYYSHLGTFLWLANPTYCLACCLRYYPFHPFVHLILQALDYSLLIPTIMYAWCEAAYACHIIREWREHRPASAKKAE